ncbi:MAG: penicillin-binding transpeptidase domain-containing protein [Eubacteriales bacterium]|nr:penicillin-binding transpeptidase domain-containing protein [Eubacteriales bacterium]MDD3197512.1 penicillin-binding transpeptidase domain-containing protein [Eubacteriales bacterium]MDD3502483.1 penicillin-binding transpeptidase domain-containing protein [Eubacteriales bacterium]MDD4682160.1 penicillin-binding transpeptidase domain-containing protein [Eubacteriales bacterium]
MAQDLKKTYYIFDHDEAQPLEMSEEKRPGIKHRVSSFLRSRFAIMSIAFSIAGIMIFYRTAALQLDPGAVSGVSESSGISRQQVIQAPRGDIYDASGVALAYSESIPVLFLSYAGLDDESLNTMLLDLALTLESYGVEIDSELLDYFELDHTSCDHDPGEGQDCGIAVFKKNIEEVKYWQSNQNLFALKEIEKSTKSDFADDYVKTDPEEFYKYLLYSKYKIENYESDGLRYSREDALRIMKLRYLIMKNNWSFINGTPVEIARNLPDELISLINEQNFRFMGTIIDYDSQRAYSDQVRYLSHVIGYIGRISSSQYEQLRELGYEPDAMIGQAGVESSAERYLSGQNGVKPYNIWSVSAENGVFFPQSTGKDAVPGNDIQLTIELPLQKLAQTSLEQVIEQIRNSPDNKNKGDADAGSVVVLNAKTGAVLAMASYPYYDPNDFLIQSYDEEAAKRVSQYLQDNDQKPMMNRAIMEIYAPGSTFKPVTAVAALESGAITPTSSVIRCRGSEVIGDWPWRCLEYPVGGHGDLTLTRGMATSCNMYFYHLGVKTGVDNIDYWGRKLGLGELTGIDLPGEVKGYRSSRDTKILLRSNPADQIWFPADTCQTAIGQFDNSFTVLQLARYTAAVATGNLVTPHVVSQVIRHDGVVIEYNNPEPQPIGMEQTTLDAVREAMVAVSRDNEGTARKYFSDYPIDVAAKTGTAETGKEDVSSSNGLFICYAPADDPEIVIAQIIEKGAWGSNTIGIAKNILDAWFGFDSDGSPSDLVSEPAVSGLGSDTSENEETEPN